MVISSAFPHTAEFLFSIFIFFLLVNIAIMFQQIIESFFPGFGMLKKRFLRLSDLGEFSLGWLYLRGSKDAYFQHDST
jgi:hypothetical protein